MDIRRQYTSRRASIQKALAEKLKVIDGTGDFRVNLYGNVLPRLVFWDELQEYPAVSLSIGPENRVYQGGGYKDRFLTITVKCYVREDDSLTALEALLEDVETVIENNGRLAYQDSSGATQYTQDILVISIVTDEGVLNPLGVGEMLLQVRY